MRSINRGRRRPRHLLCLGALLAALAVVGPGGGVASADCTSGGSGCLPGSGYTLDTVWNCGPLYPGFDCYANGTTIFGNAVTHTFGWGSASFPEVPVCIQLGPYAGACATNVARVCYQANCNDQNANSFRAEVHHRQTGIAWTISGHAKA